MRYVRLRAGRTLGELTVTHRQSLKQSNKSMNEDGERKRMSIVMLTYHIAAPRRSVIDFKLQTWIKFLKSISKWFQETFVPALRTTPYRATTPCIRSFDCSEIRATRTFIVHKVTELAVFIFLTPNVCR